MERYCDLHTHSYFSDGTDSPAEILEKAAALGLSAVALTDHNTVAGLPELLEAAEGRDILAVPGVEISTSHQGKELHIVGLLLDHSVFEQVTDYLGVINRRKEESNRNLVRSLNDAGYDLCYEEIKARRQGSINRAVIAAALVEKGYIAEIREAFVGLLAEGKGFYVPPERLSSLETIAFLKSVHAVPVLAHPILNLREDELVEFIRQAKPLGLAAMETRYSTYTLEITAAAERIAEEFGLLQSGGSDYHGANKPDIRLGTGRGTLAVPDRFADCLLDYRRTLA